MLSIGLMSGTSMDGIDAALIETDGTDTGIQELGHISLSYSPELKLLLKAAEYAVRQKEGDLQAAEKSFETALPAYLKHEVGIPDKQLSQKMAELVAFRGQDFLHLKTLIQHSTQLHAEVVRNLLKQTGLDRKKIDVIGYHGQTLYHQPSMKRSVIVGEGQALADELGITVVYDFRAQDVAAGGQGAPFAPLYHRALALRDGHIPAAIVNCGGIANITLIQNKEENDLIAFDTGPGNGLIDRLVKQRTKGLEQMDQDGRYGRQGKICDSTLQALFDKSVLKNGKNYLLQAPPKALDIGDLKLIAELDLLSLEDACATLEAFTAETIVRSFDLVKAELPSQWVLAGGGWNNPVIRELLKERLEKRALKKIKIMLADELGWNSQAMEAQLFAYLAVRSLQKKPLSLPGTTGVPYPMLGGTVCLPS